MPLIGAKALLSATVGAVAVGVNQRDAASVSAPTSVRHVHWGNSR